MKRKLVDLVRLEQLDCWVVCLVVRLNQRTDIPVVTK